MKNQIFHLFVSPIVPISSIFEYNYIGHFELIFFSGNAMFNSENKLITTTTTTPLALVTNLVIRWRLLHKFQVWSPDGATCISYTCIAILPWIVLLTLSVCIELVSSSARVKSVKFTNVSELETNPTHRSDQGHLGPIKIKMLQLVREDPWNDKCCSNGFCPNRFSTPPPPSSNRARWGYFFRRKLVNFLKQRF